MRYQVLSDRVVGCRPGDVVEFGDGVNVRALVRSHHIVATDEHTTEPDDDDATLEFDDGDDD